MMCRIYAKNVGVWTDVHVCWCRCFTYVLVQMDTCPVSFQVLDFPLLQGALGGFSPRNPSLFYLFLCVPITFIFKIQREPST